jgi:hypothetical protein
VQSLDSTLEDAGIDAEERESVEATQTDGDRDAFAACPAKDADGCGPSTGSDAVGPDSERKGQDGNRLRPIEAQKVDSEMLVRLTSALDMFKPLAGALSNASCLSLAERSRLREG